MKTTKDCTLTLKISQGQAKLFCHRSRISPMSSLFISLPTIWRYVRTINASCLRFRQPIHNVSTYKKHVHPYSTIDGAGSHLPNCTNPSLEAAKFRTDERESCWHSSVEKELLTGRYSGTPVPFLCNSYSYNSWHIIICTVIAYTMCLWKPPVSAYAYLDKKTCGWRQPPMVSFF